MSDTRATTIERVTELEESPIRRPLLTIVTPAYNEAENLPVLYQRLGDVLASTDTDWEWIVVDDHSTDGTFEVFADLAGQDGRLRGFRFSRNFGSHTAVTCGLHRARGDCAIVLAADLQDPPEEIPHLLAEWQQGAQVIWAVRARREGEGATYLGFARLYYALMRRTGALRDLPAAGADFFLLDRVVIDAFNQFHESHVSILALITWMGFRQATISYHKQARLHGRSGWSLEKKLKLVVDSITSFTYFPVRLMSYVGFSTALFGFLYAGFVIFNALRGHPPQGWASLMVVVLVLGGIQMVMLGVLGEYLWRALDEARRRPRYLIEGTTESNPDAAKRSSHD
ncbi:MAG: glycosyltransferase family 2 protein [Chloroflexi bacterium]|nr:glycosyltransferase family 2 protein [Chloroflexota bacterium]